MQKFNKNGTTSCFYGIVNLHFSHSSEYRVNDNREKEIV